MLSECSWCVKCRPGMASGICHYHMLEQMANAGFLTDAEQEELGDLLLERMAGATR